MKRKQFAISDFQSMPQNVLASLKGGDEEDDTIVYIDGIPYKIKTNKDGTTVYIPINL